MSATLPLHGAADGSFFLDHDHASQLLSNSLVAAAAHASASGVTIADAGHPDCPLVYVNEAFCTLTGYEPEEALGRNCRFLQGPFAQECAPARAELRRAIATGEKATVRLRNVRKDGTPFWNEVTLLAFSRGPRSFVVGLQLDVTAQVLVASQQEQFRLERERLYESIADGLYLVQGGKLVYANRAGLRLIGAASADQVRGMSVERVAPPGLSQLHHDNLGRLRAGQQITSYEMPCRRLDGTMFTSEVSASLVEHRGRPALQALVRDVSARRLERDILEHERAALEQIAHDAPLDQVLGQLCRAIQRQIPESRCSVWLADEEGPHPAPAPARGMRLYWSQTFSRADGRMAGTFAVYHPRPHAPDEGELRLLQISARLAEVAVRQRRLSSSLSWIETERDLLVSTVASGIVTLTTEGVIVSANPAACRMLGRPAETLQGMNARDLLADAVTESGRLLLGPSEAGIRLKPVRDFVLRLSSPEGGQRWLSVNVSGLPTRDAAAGAATFVCSFNDVTQLKLAQQQLVTMATRDELTKLPNRAALAQAAQHAIRAAGLHGRELAMLVMDLDGFKHVNDTFGHAAGDTLLRDVAARLASVMRPTDILARRSGDEFVILACDADEAGASKLAGRVLESLRTPFVVAGREVFASASIGAAVYPGHGGSESELFGLADAAMYRAKRAGRNRFAMHEAGASLGERDRLVRETELRYAISRQELRLHYQPRVEAAGGRIVGVEALVRWQHPERGLVPPMEFIELAEETGLIGPIGDWVLREACRQAARWRRQGLPDLQISVNVSARQFSEAFFARTVPGALAESGLPASRLELEITESTMMSQTDAATLAALQALRDQGVGVLLDDFGTGYSSLSYLHKFPLDGLKIDRSFIAPLQDNAEARAVTRTIVALAAVLKLHTVAEGVETPWQCDWLVKAGSGELQGYLFSRPLPGGELTKLLRREAARRALPPECLAAQPARLRYAPAPDPADEQARLQALRAAGLLDTPRDATLDAITESVSRLLAVPIALVSLVDENRQWFKSKVGLSAGETPRGVSFCAHAIHSDEPFVVEDAAADARFADNPLVTGAPHVRFYAGAPITARDALGLPRRIGTLCVIDHQPRALGPDQLALLVETARIVSRHVDHAGAHRLD